MLHLLTEIAASSTGSRKRRGKGCLHAAQPQLSQTAAMALRSHLIGMIPLFVVSEPPDSMLTLATNHGFWDCG